MTTIQTIQMTETRRRLRGKPYTLDQFRQKYDLSEQQAASLFSRFGPSSIELDLLMAAKRKSPALPDISRA